MKNDSVLPTYTCEHIRDGRFRYQSDDLEWETCEIPPGHPEMTHRYIRVMNEAGSNRPPQEINAQLLQPNCRLILASKHGVTPNDYEINILANARWKIFCQLGRETHGFHLDDKKEAKNELWRGRAVAGLLWSHGQENHEIINISVSPIIISNWQVVFYSLIDTLRTVAASGRIGGVSPSITCAAFDKRTWEFLAR